MDELSDEKKLSPFVLVGFNSSCHRTLTTLRNGSLVSRVLMYRLKKRSRLKQILEGKYDDYPEDAFRSVGRIEEVVEKG